MMDIKTATEFFTWCTVINVALLILSTLICAFAPDWLYNMHGNLFSIPRETLDLIMYSYLGLFKIFIYIFNVVPLVALLIIGRKGN